MKHLHIDRTPHESRLHVVLYGLFDVFLYYYLLHASLCFTNHWHAKVKHRGTTLSFFRHQLLIYAALQKTSNCDSYLRNARILKFSRKDIIWCSYKKITFNTLYRLILGYNVWWNWLDFNFRFIRLFCLFNSLRGRGVGEGSSQILRTTMDQVKNLLM